MAKNRQEQEAQKDENQQCKLYSFKEEKARYRISFLGWDKIKRANQRIKPIRQKSFFLSSLANKVLSVAIAKLKRDERVIFNHKYISTFTFVERKQNVRIIKELADILDITYHNSITHNGRKYRHCYEFSLKQQNPENISSVEQSTGTFMSRQNDSLYIYNKKDNIEKIRSNVRAHESNFLQKSEEVSTPVKPIRLKKRKPNERKKPTNTARKAKVVHFNQYKTPKNLKDHYPLNQEDCRNLQNKSGRLFTLNTMNEILLDMSNRKGNTFCSKYQFLAYFGKCLKYELRDAVKTSNDKFYIKANYPHLYGNTVAVTKKAQEESPPIVLPEGIFGEICTKLVKVTNINVYRNWISRLLPKINEEAKMIELHAPCSLTHREVETNYLETIKKIAKSLNMEVKLCQK